jgi:hypothetical protein
MKEAEMNFLWTSLCVSWWVRAWLSSRTAQRRCNGDEEAEMNWAWPTPFAALLVNEACLGHFDHAQEVFHKALKAAGKKYPVDSEVFKDAIMSEGSYLLRVCFQRYVFDVQVLYPGALSRPGCTEPVAFVDMEGNEIEREAAPPVWGFVQDLFMAFVNEDEEEWNRLLWTAERPEITSRALVQRVLEMVRAQYELSRLESQYRYAEDHGSNGVPDTVPEEWLRGGEA